RLGMFFSGMVTTTSSLSRAASPGDHAQAARWLCCLPEIPDLRVVRALEGRPPGAALDVGCEARIACDDVGVLQNPQHRRHHQIAGRETVAIEVGFVAERLGETRQAPLCELH